MTKAARARKRRKSSPVKLVCKRPFLDVGDDMLVCNWKCPGAGAPRQGAPVVMFRHRERRDWYAILHPSARNKGKWQVTAFDNDGPIGDVVRADCAEALRDGLWDGPRAWMIDRTANIFGGLRRARGR